MNMTAKQNTISNSTPVITNGITTATTLVSVLLAIALVDSLGMVVVGDTVDCVTVNSAEQKKILLCKLLRLSLAMHVLYFHMFT